METVAHGVKPPEEVDVEVEDETEAEVEVEVVMFSDSSSSRRKTEINLENLYLTLFFGAVETRLEVVQS